ncbi:MAG: hypothetical protein LBK61_04380 [Spirochaetaceae bacterium]|nr:hypothetical protein [Spirochaetaceae bacterium]
MRPLPGAKTLRVFIECPAGGENPQGFHPVVNHFRCETYPQFWSKEQRHGRQSTPLRRLCFPFGRAMPP